MVQNHGYDIYINSPLFSMVVASAEAKNPKNHNKINLKLLKIAFNPPPKH
jgi:hypothetical protein